MDDPSHKTRGLAIGSGRIENVNESVIGFRMKRSGTRRLRMGSRTQSFFKSQALF